MSNKQQMARVVKMGRTFDVVTMGAQLISGGYSREDDAISTAHRLGYDVEGHNSTPARKAYDRKFMGFNPAGFAGFKDGYDAAVEDQATTHAQLRRALERAIRRIPSVGNAQLLEELRSALALPPMEERE